MLDPVVDPRALDHLDDLERACVRRYAERIVEALGTDLREVWLFGSFARGDAWGPRSPMHSDIDLLVVTDTPVPPDRQEALLNETYKLFLECGRQISPQFRTSAWLSSPPDVRGSTFTMRLREEGKLLLRRTSTR